LRTNPQFFNLIAASGCAWSAAIEFRASGRCYQAAAGKVIESLSRRQMAESLRTASHQVCIEASGFGLANAVGVSSATQQAGDGSRTDRYWIAPTSAARATRANACVAL
jgi:hypothetical protein